MEWEPIRKRPPDFAGANLRDYSECARTFSWAQARALLDGLPGGGLNIAYEAVDRHVKNGKGSKPAILWEGKDGAQETYTFEDLSKLSNKWCNVLRNLGIKKGDRVFVFLDRIPELYAAVFGTLKAGCVIGPLFAAFGPDAVRDRLE